jgi:hypothetical protein
MAPGSEEHNNVQEVCSNIEAERPEGLGLASVSVCAVSREVL